MQDMFACSHAMCVTFGNFGNTGPEEDEGCKVVSSVQQAIAGYSSESIGLQACGQVLWLVQARAWLIPSSRNTKDLHHKLGKRQGSLY